LKRWDRLPEAAADPKRRAAIYRPRCYTSMALPSGAATMLDGSLKANQAPRPHRPAAVSCLFMILIAASLTCARADVRVQGDVAAVRIDANQSRVSEVLSALGSTFNLRYRTPIPLDEAISGTFKGSLREVIARLLEGFNYVVKTERDAIEVVVVGRRGERAIPAAPQTPASKSLASQWRSPIDKPASGQ
jgi:hypothetical protein